MDSSQTAKQMVLIPTLLHLLTTYYIPYLLYGALVPDIANHMPRTGQLETELIAKKTTAICNVKIFIILIPYRIAIFVIKNRIQQSSQVSFIHYRLLLKQQLIQINKYKPDCMQTDKSLLIGDESQEQLSLLSVLKTKSDAQLKHEQLFRQASEYRSQIRQLRQDIQWLKTNNEGFQNQCHVLKDLLNEKKQMLIDANTQLRIANQEINRLEDLLNEKNCQIEKLESSIRDKDKYIANKTQTIIKLQCEIESKNTQFQSMLKQKQSSKTEYHNKQKVLLQKMQQKLISIFNQSQRAYKMPQTHSPSKHQKNLNEQDIFSNLLLKIETLVEKQNQMKLNYQHKIDDKSAQIVSKQEKMGVLESQLRQASDIVQQYQQKHRASERMYKQLYSKWQLHQKQTKQNTQKMSQAYKQSIHKIFQLLHPLFPNQNALPLIKLGQQLQRNQSPYEVEILLKQLRPLIESHAKSGQQLVGLKKQLRDMQTNYQLLREQYDTIRIKLMALQRQYQAVVQDNRRIIKFNQLSRYRTNRNLHSTQHSHSPHKQSKYNKQNKQINSNNDNKNDNKGVRSQACT